MVEVLFNSLLRLWNLRRKKLRDMVNLTRVTILQKNMDLGVEEYRPPCVKKPTIKRNDV